MPYAQLATALMGSKALGSQEPRKDTLITYKTKSGRTKVDTKQSVKAYLVARPVQTLALIGIGATVAYFAIVKPKIDLNPFDNFKLGLNLPRFKMAKIF